MCGVIPALSRTSRSLVKHRGKIVFYLQSKCADLVWIHFWPYFAGSAQWGSRVYPGPVQQASDTSGAGGGGGLLSFCIITVNLQSSKHVMQQRKSSRVKNYAG
jgi:hypothetical protein